MIESFKHHEPMIDQTAWVHASAVVIGQVTMGAEVSVWPNVTIRGDVNTVTLGARTNVQDGSVLHVTSPGEGSPNGFALTVGNDVTVGHKVTLHGCTVGDRCLIGMGATILDGAVLDDDVFIAAGSLVTPGKHLESGYLYQGQPAKQTRKLSEQELAFFKQSAAHYVELMQDYL